MQHYEARMGPDGLLPLPSKVSNTFEVREGDVVDFYVSDDSLAIRLIVRNKRLADLAGFLGSKLGPMTPADVDRAIGDHLEEKHARTDRESREWREFEASKWAGKPSAARGPG